MGFGRGNNHANMQQARMAMASGAYGHPHMSQQFFGGIFPPQGYPGAYFPHM